MKPSEVAELLIVDAGLNRYASAANQSAEKAVAWAAALNLKAADLGFMEARDLVVEHYASSEESLTPYALIELWERKHRRLPHQVRADVRSAKARGLIPREHRESDPIPSHAAAALLGLRTKEVAEVQAYEVSPKRTPLQLDAGRRM